MNQPPMLSSNVSESRGLTHVDDLARPSLDANVSVLSEGGTLHTGSRVGIVVRSIFECEGGTR
jgi:hypothetical protein